MSFETIQVEAGGSRYEGWTTCSVSAADGQAARDFVLTVAEIDSLSGFNWPLLPGTPVSVRASGDLLVRGHVREYRPEGTAESHTVTICGDGLGGELVRSSPLHPTGYFENLPAVAIVQALAGPFGVPIGLQAAALGVVPAFQIQRGSTVWTEAMRLLQGFGLSMRGEADGSVTITDGFGRGLHGGSIEQGRNILRMSATLSEDGRYALTTVIGQSPDGWEADQLQPKGIAADPGVSRFTHREVVDGAATTPARAQQRALNEMRRGFMLSTKAQIVVPGFRDDGGALWEPGRLAFVHAPWLKIEQVMKVDAVEFNQDGQAGTTTTLSLVDDPGGGARISRSADFWRFTQPPLDPSEYRRPGP